MIDNLKANENIHPNSRDMELLKADFPQFFDKEGEFCIDRFKKMLRSNDITLTKEGYELNFLGKSYARYLSSTKTETFITPDIVENAKDENKNSENLYIVGDNLDALKHLLESYAGKIKCIYIDPPYNTGSDGFVYPDNFSFNAKELADTIGIEEEEAERIINLKGKSSHSAWLTFMYPRLILARELLSDDGVIFISIDDNEQANLKMACDEVFGEENFIAQLIWERAYSPKNDAKHVSNSHDYILMYSKLINNFKIGRLARTEEANARYINPDNDPRGAWKPSDLSVKTYNKSCDYLITTPSGRIVEPPAGRCWRLSEKAFSERLQDNRIWFGTDGNSVPQMKRFLSELKFEGMAPTSLLFYKEVGHSQEGAKEVVELFEGQGVFDGPKPTRLLQRLLRLANLEQDSIVLDFFSGSATTAHAVMQLNAEDGGNRQFILVQLPEQIKEDKPAYKAGYRTIDEIGRERIRSAAKKIQEETNADIDYGFRVYKVDSTNMKDVYYMPNDLEQGNLAEFESNIKEDRTTDDLLTQVILDLGLSLDLKIEEKMIGKNKLYYVAGNSLIACFDDSIDIDIVDKICECEPYKVVFKDNAFNTDNDKINLEERFKKLLPQRANDSGFINIL